MQTLENLGPVSSLDNELNSKSLYPKARQILQVGEYANITQSDSIKYFIFNRTIACIVNVNVRSLAMRIARVYFYTQMIDTPYSEIPTTTRRMQQTIY